MPAGDLSEEVDEAQSCGAKPPGEEEAYDADSESNPEEMAKPEEGRYTHTRTHTCLHSALCICLYALGCLVTIGRVFPQCAFLVFPRRFSLLSFFFALRPLSCFFKQATNVN